VETIDPRDLDLTRTLPGHPRHPGMGRHRAPGLRSANIPELRPNDHRQERRRNREAASEANLVKSFTAKSGTPDDSSTTSSARTIKRKPGPSSITLSRDRPRSTTPSPKNPTKAPSPNVTQSSAQDDEDYVEYTDEQSSSPDEDGDDSADDDWEPPTRGRKGRRAAWGDGTRNSCRKR
jgi:hypothetical protein